jgi:hypothetical protein
MGPAKLTGQYKLNWALSRLLNWLGSKYVASKYTYSILFFNLCTASAPKISKRGFEL